MIGWQIKGFSNRFGKRSHRSFSLFYRPVRRYRLAHLLGIGICRGILPSRSGNGTLHSRVQSFFALFVLVILLPASLSAKEEVPEADALVLYASSLGKTGEAVRFGADGLTIKGGSLHGEAIVRPSIALARAAELYAEAAEANNSTGLLQRALSLWDSLNDPHTPVPYLRSYARQKKAQNPAFATFCEVALASCYLKQGDPASGEKLLSAYATATSSTEMNSLARATYAAYRLRAGDFETARTIAEEVKEHAPPTGLQAKLEDGYHIASAVLSEIPGAAKTGGLLASSKQAQLLDQVESSPRRYLNLGDSMYMAGDKRKAILYWSEFRKRFPTESAARSCALRSGGAYEELKEIDKAIEEFRGISLQYPEYIEGARATVKAALLLYQSDRSKDAFDFLDAAAKRLKTAAGQAWILATQGQLYFQSKMMDEAAEKYMGLLIKYGDQDAAKDAIASLRKVAPQVKNWKKFTQAIQHWLSGKYGHPSQLGNAEMNLSDASQLRRLALGFYVEENNVSGGLSWLKALGMQSEEKERSWLIRDEAWLYGQIARHSIPNASKLHKYELSSTIKLGTRAWSIAPGTEEGLAGLRAAQALAANTAADRTTVRQFIKELENLRGGDFDAEIVRMLIPLYEIVGDQKSVEELRRNDA